MFAARPPSQSGRAINHGARTVRSSREAAVRSSLESLPSRDASRGSTPVPLVQQERPPTPEFMQEDVEPADELADWLVDDVGQFLQCPEWTAPVQTFVDENCAYFDTDPDEEGRLEWTTLHSRFRELVEQVLGQHLSELGLTAERFAAAVGSGANKELDELVYDYVAAFGDFRVFRNVMVKRNVELELEALAGLDEVDEEALLKAAIEESLRQPDRAPEDEDAELQEAMRLSQAEEEARRRGDEEAAMEAAKAAEAVRERVAKKRKKKKRRRSKSRDRGTAAAGEEEGGDAAEGEVEGEGAAGQPPVPEEVEEELDGAAQQTVQQAPIPRLRGALAPLPGARPMANVGLPPQAPVPPPAVPRPPPAPRPQAPVQEKEGANEAGISQEMLERRAIYLRQQREKLIEQKRAQREADLVKYQREKGFARPASVHGSRPSTSEVQRRQQLAARMRDDLL
eukprot:Hpha_TRINITY_DN26483_c0_g1::TRINITY_DN26483_c0_g1_i1::g.33860::m.33860